MFICRKLFCCSGSVRGNNFHIKPSRRIWSYIHLVIAEKTHIIPYSRTYINFIKRFLHKKKKAKVKLLIIRYDEFGPFIGIDLIHPIHARE